MVIWCDVQPSSVRRWNGETLTIPRTRARTAVRLGQPFVLAEAIRSARWTAMPVPGAKIPLPPSLHTPRPTDPIPEGTQRVGMVQRNQARRLPAHCPEGRVG